MHKSGYVCSSLFIRLSGTRPTSRAISVLHFSYDSPGHGPQVWLCLSFTFHTTVRDTAHKSGYLCPSLFIRQSGTWPTSRAISVLHFSYDSPGHVGSRASSTHHFRLSQPKRAPSNACRRAEFAFGVRMFMNRRQRQAESEKRRRDRAC